jgi:hypothetical protein
MRRDHRSKTTFLDAKYLIGTTPCSALANLNPKGAFLFFLFLYTYHITKREAQLKVIGKMLRGAADIHNHEKRVGDVHRIANGKRYKKVMAEKVMAMMSQARKV